MSDTSAERREVILVADDVALNRSIVEAILTSAGYEVRLVDSGEGAVDSCVASVPDLVLLDVMMPGIGGIAACREIRALPSGTDVPIVFLTALDDTATHEQALASGADDFLSKPIRRIELLIRVRSLLRLNRLTRELRKNYEVIREQRDSLVRLERQRKDLTSFVVHDLKNPLAGILANIEFLQILPGLPEEAREAASDAFMASQAMQRMLLNLLDLARSDDGRLAIRLEETDVGELVAELHSVTKRRLAIAGLRLVAAPNLAGANVMVDRELLRRLIENLLDNCIKYSPPSGKIELSACEVADGIELRISDEGPGIPEEARASVFEKWEQLERLEVGSRVESRTSRGLGLVFCRLAAEAHGGKIWVEDNRPRGASFCLRLPTSVAQIERSSGRVRAGAVIERWR